MKRRIRVFFIYILLAIISGCAGRPVFSVEVYKTATPLQAVVDPNSASPSAQPIIASTISPIAPYTPLPEEENVSPIVYSEKAGDWLLLLGGVKKNGEWLQPVDVAPYLHGGAFVDFYQSNSMVPVTLLDWNYDQRCKIYYVHSNGSIPGQGVAVRRDWAIHARPTREISADDPAYSQAVADWLQSQGASSAEIHVNRITQVDLEGDGVNEVLLSATYYASTTLPVSQAGDYSVVLLRKVVGNDVVTIPVVAEYYISATPEATFPNSYSLVDAIDLNQDGILEIVVGIRRWEGLGAAVFAVSGETSREVLKEFCSG